MKRNATINDAKELAYSLQKRGVLILTLSEGKVAGASYGMDRKTCAAMGRLLDWIVDKIIRGEVSADTLPGEARP
jgi:hypothetical protein